MRDRSQEQNLGALFWDASLDAIRLTDLEGVVLRVNKAYSELVGKSREELEGRLFTEIYHEQDRQRILAAYQERMANKHVQSRMHRRLRLWNGQERWLDSSVSLVATPRGPAVLTVLRDITQLKNTEEQLRTERSRLADILNAMRAGIWDWNIETGKRAFNARWADMIGYGVDELDESIDSWYSLVHPEDRATSEQLLASHLAGEIEYYDCECRVRHKQGHWVWVHDRGRIVEWTKQGHPRRMAGTHVDITARKEMELLVRRSRDQARRLALISERTTDAVVLMDVRGRVDWVNPGFERMSGYLAEQVRGCDALRLFLPEGAGDTYRRLQEAMFVGVREQILCRFKGHREAWLDLELQPIHNDQGVLTGFSAVASDVTAQVALRTRLEAIVAALAEGLVLLDVNGNIVDCNTRAEQILGVRKEDLIGRSGVGPEWDARSEAGARIPDWQFPVTQVLQSGQPVRGFLMGVMRPDGERRWIEINAQLLKDGLGGIIGVVTSFADITERRQMQQAILESEARFRALADAAPMMVWLAGPTGEWADCNRIWQDFTGLALSRGVPWGWTSAIHPEDREFCLKKYSEAFRNRCSEEIEFRLRRRDGVYRWVLDRFNPRYGPAGDFQGFVGGCVDITGRREMEEQLRQANLRARHMALAVEQAPASIFLCDCDGLITYVNSTFCKVTGYQPEEVIGKNPRILQSGQTPRAVYQQMWANLTSGKPWRGEVLNRKKNGELYWELMLLAPLTDDSGATAGYLCVKEDITESKRNAEEIQDANRRLEQAMLRAQELACQAEAANVSKSEFLANMSHEIRTPMNGILGTAGLLLETELDAEQREHVETICASSESLLKIINDLLDFSKIEAGKLELETIELPVRDIVSGVAATLSPLAQRKGLLLRTSIDPDIPPVVLGDPGRLRQILVNLVGNAVKFTEAGEVSIEACRVDSTPAPELGPVREPAGLMVRFTVRDTGIGIPQDQIDRLFDEFTQLDASTTRRFGGTGLGLSISRRLVQMMGGQIGAQSQLGKGSEFWFTIQFGLPSPTGESASFTPHTAASLAAVRPNPNRHGRRSVCKQCKETVAAAQGLERASAEYSHGSVQNRKPDHGAPGRADSRVRETGCGLESLDEARIVERASSAPAQATGGMLASREPNANGSGLAAPRSPLQRYHVDPHLIRAIAERKATILLAEDNTINRRVAMGILKKFGIVTHTAENGQQAVDALQRRSFDLVLMDVHMPGMDGLEATRAIRALAGPNSRTPIIAMTASVMPEDRNSCLQAGMNDFVSKPVDLAALAEVLNRWLAASVESGGEAGDRPELSVR